MIYKNVNFLLTSSVMWFCLHPPSSWRQGGTPNSACNAALMVAIDKVEYVQSFYILKQFYSKFIYIYKKAFASNTKYLI